MISTSPPISELSIAYMAVFGSEISVDISMIVALYMKTTGMMLAGAVASSAETFAEIVVVLVIAVLLYW